MPYVIQLRRDTMLRWELKNPILAEGEPGVETNTGKLKMGDGVHTWLELPYFSPDDGDLTIALEQHIESETPHPVYDDGPSLSLLYQNAKV